MWIVHCCSDTCNGSTSKMTVATLRTTCSSTSPTYYTLWIYPLTSSGPLIYQASYLFSKDIMSLWTLLPYLPRKDSLDGRTSMTVTSTLNSPILLVYHHYLFYQPPSTNQPNYLYFPVLFISNKVLLSKRLYSWPLVSPPRSWSSTAIRMIF